MEDIGWFLLFVVGIAAAMVARHWYRRWVAAKLADRILAEVLRDKDSFRR
jgi:hypothetical protein